MAKKLIDEIFPEILGMLVEGQRYSDIAAKYDCAISTLFAFLHKDEFSARVKEAMALSAAMYAEKAEEAVLRAPSDSVEITRARELAQHYRWMAGKRNPRAYGDKLDLTTDGEKIPNVIPAINVYNMAPPLAASEGEVSE